MSPYAGVRTRISTDSLLAPTLNAYNDIPGLLGDPPISTSIAQLPIECLMLIDSGYSNTTVTPLLYGRPLQQATRRLDIGGKFMTNYLKEQFSTRQVDMSDETYVVDEIKKNVCFVSDDFRRDLERTWKGGPRDVDLSIMLDYVLPDYEIRHFPEMRPHDPTQTVRTRKLAAGPGPKEMVLSVGKERFNVPELLFSPSNVGMKEAGLPDVVMQSLESLPQSLWPAMLGNIVTVGGNTQIPGFLKRLESEIRQRVPSDYVVRVACPPE